VNPLRLETVMVDVADDPLDTVSVVGLAERLNSDEAVKVAVWTVSGTGPSPPFATSTQVDVPETLEGLQPVWNPTGVLAVDPTTL
jgi:hypothetical protein